MKYQFFTIPALDPVAAQGELNGFLSQKRICHVDREFVAAGEGSFWSFCIGWLDGQGPLLTNPTSSNKRVDYKEVLNEEDFAFYAQLREWRKSIAQRDGTPPYTVFTNEQLAAIVQQKINNRSVLRSIEEIGHTRVEKYGEAVLVECKRILQAGSDETNAN